MVTFDRAEAHMESIFNGCLVYLNKNLREHKNIQLDVKFRMDIEKQNIYASAGKRPDGGYLVKVSMASYNKVHEYFNKMICVEGFYKSITLKEEFDETVATEYSKLLIDMTLRTIIFHELGHIFNGHIDYIQLKINEYKALHFETEHLDFIPEYLERSKKARPYLTPIDWQALEWNADDFAITRLIGQYTYQENIDGDIIKSIDHSFFLVTVAVVSMYCLMDMNLAKQNIDFSEYQLEEHLPKRFRLHKYIEVAIIATKRLNGIELFRKNDEKERFSLVIKRFEEWYVLYIKATSGILSSGESLDEHEEALENNMEELDQKHLEYYQKVDNYYTENLPNELADFSYFEIYI